MTVRFVDYGNTSEVTEVAPLPPKLTLIAPQAVAIHLEASLPETALSVIETLQVNATQFTLTKTDQGTCELLLNGFNLTTYLSGRLPLAVNDVVYICHVESPELIYLQRNEDASLLTEIAEKLQITELAELAAEAVPNQLLAAKFEFDGQWYRARVDGDKVSFSFSNY